MLHSTSSVSADQDAQNCELLQELLCEYTPGEVDMVRPVALRSTAEQRRFALKSFLVRTWVDHTLHRIERLLAVLLLLFFGYWVINGYGIDWLHAANLYQANLDARPTLDGVARSAVIVPEIAIGQMERSGSNQALALPFVDPDMDLAAATPDYIAPQPLVVSEKTADARPHRLVIPQIQVETPVIEVFVERGTWQVAEYAAGYHHGSALPGATGNMVVAGHAGLRGAVFRDLGQLQIGDDILVDAGGWEYGYQVREIKSVWPTQVEVMNPTPTAVLTLITCTAWDTQRLVVIADLVVSRPLT